jgi:hypothetical protein
MMFKMSLGERVFTAAQVVDPMVGRVFGKGPK